MRWSIALLLVLLAAGSARADGLQVELEVGPTLLVEREQPVTVRAWGHGSPCEVTLTVAEATATGGEPVTIGAATLEPGAGARTIAVTVPRDLLGARLSAAARLVATARLAGSQERGRRASAEVVLLRPVRAHVWLDKPLYRAGETVRARALIADAVTGAALAGEAVSLRHLAPPSGGRPAARIGQADARTDRWGLVSAAFPLSDEVALGPHRIELVHASGEVVATGEAEVSRYALPPFRVSLELDRPFYLPDELMRGRVQAVYPDGRPVADAQVTVAFAVPDADFGLGTLSGKTDASGVMVFDRRVPKEPFEEWFGIERAVLTVDAAVTDAAGAIRSARTVTRLAAEPLGIRLIPEAGSLVAGVDNRVHIEVTGPAGDPVRGAAVRLTAKRGVRLQDTADPAAAEGMTDALGLATFTLAPEAQLEDGDAIDLAVEAVGPSGARVSEDLEPDVRAASRGLIVRPDRFVVGEGEPVRALVLNPGGKTRLVLQLLRGDVVVAQRSVEVDRGRDPVSIEPPADVAGELTLAVIVPDGWDRRAARRILVRGGRGIDLVITSDRARYRPGEKGAITVQTSRDGRPAPAAVGIVVVDERLFSIRPRTGPSAVARFTLSPELAGSALARVALGSFRDGAEPVPEEIDRRLERAVEGLGALLPPPPPSVTRVDSASADLAVALQQLQRIATAMDRLRGYLTYDGRWDDPLGWLREHGELAAADLVDPWGGAVRFEKRGFWIFAEWALVTDGPDGETETDDDVVLQIVD